MVEYILRENANAEENKKQYVTFKANGRIDFITFHPSYSYEEFIEGVTIKRDHELENNSCHYTRKDGFFKKICAKALFAGLNPNEKNFSKYDWERKEKWAEIFKRYKEKFQSSSKKEQDIFWANAPAFVLVIDEINRGDISKIFGELITLLEKDKRLGADNELTVKLPYTDDEFGVPQNIYIIGTMNTADRSIALLDVALRRRFGFEEMRPNLVQLREDFAVEKGGQNLLAKSIDKLEEINEKIKEDESLGKEKGIGHAFFYAVKNDDDVLAVWENEIFPLLDEYYYGEYNRLQNLMGEEVYSEKNGFVRDNKEIIKNWLNKEIDEREE
jgi:5-methylcytosine-specific restriction protein B